MQLIDADELIEMIWRERVDSREAIEKVICRQPVIDAVPVVRCRDCKWWKTIDGGGDLKFCTYVIGAYFVRKGEDYCSRGERKDDE